MEEGAHGEEATFSPAEALKAELEKKDAEIKRLGRELDSARMKSASSSTANVGEKIKEVKGVKVLAHRVDNLERAQLRTLVDQLRDKIGSGVVVLGSASNGNVALIVGVTKFDFARSGWQSDWPGGAKGGRQGRRSCGSGGSWRKRCVRAGCRVGRGIRHSGGIAGMISDDDVKDRLRFVKHKGQAIFLIDFSNCEGKEILLLLDQVQAQIARHAPGSVLTLADVNGAKIDKTVATKVRRFWCSIVLM